MQAAKKRHRHMGVAIDESGENQLAARIDRLRASVLSFDFGSRANSDDRVASDDNGAVIVDGSRAVHRDDGAASDDKVGSILGRLRRKRNGKTTLKGEKQNQRLAKGHFSPQQMKKQTLSKQLSQP